MLFGMALQFLAPSVLYLLLKPSVAVGQTLNYQKYLSRILDDNAPNSTAGNINIVNVDLIDEYIEVAYLPTIMTFTCYGRPTNNIGYYDGVASVALAMEHLNTGNGSIIPEISGLNETCPLRFTTESFDTECSQLTAINHVTSLTDRSMTGQLYPTAILTTSSRVSMPTSIISSLRGVPQVSPDATSSDLDNKDQYKLFGRTVPNDDGTSIPLLAKLNLLGINHLAVLYIDDSYGNAFMEGLILAAQQNAPELRIKTVNIRMNPDKEILRDVVRRLADIQYTYFFGIIYYTTIEDIMTEAYDQGIAGTGKHNWIFSDSIGSFLEGRQFEAGSKLALAFQGTGILRAAGGISGMATFDKFYKSMEQMKNDADISQIESLLPNDYDDGKVMNHSVIFQDQSFLSSPRFIPPFIFDAVIALGIASCRLRSEGTASFTGDDLFEAFKNTTFEGASGSVVLDPITGTRVPSSAVFLLKNFVYDKDATINPDTVQFKSVDSDVFALGEWDSHVSYTYNDGTSNAPPDLPPLVTDDSYPSTATKAIGMVFFAIIFVLSIGFGSWTYINRNKRIVRSSQPMFLYIISAGTIIMGSSLIPLSIDPSVTDQTGSDTACIFTKTYRVNQIVKYSAKFKRVKITATDVMKPMVALLFLNIVTLAVWTAIDPLGKNVGIDPHDRDLETYGSCTSDHSFAFLGVLSVINAGSLLVALQQAWQARKITTDLQESSYIFMAMALIVLVSGIGVPVMIISEGNSTVSYFVSACLIFVVCGSILILIYVPKLLALNERRQRQPNNTFSRSRQTPDNSTQSDEAGIMILSFPDEQKELESKVKKLTEEVTELKKENNEKTSQIDEMKKLLADIGEIEFEEEKEPGDIKKCFQLELDGDPIKLESKMKKLSRDLETMEAQVVVPIKENEEKAIEIKQMNHLLGCDEI
eukprot:scaffold159697_cov56-Cyclotella_meneghiniana.AAC.3